MTNDDLGTLDTAGERWTLTFVRTFPHPIDLVWAAVTEPEHLEVWFPQTIEGERRVGATLRFLTSDDGHDAFEGTVLEYDPPHAFAFEWGTDSLRVELRPDGDGTRLTLVDTFGELGKAARDAAGWHACLAVLTASLLGEPLPDSGAIWTAIHPAYVAALGPDAATIGPPEDCAPA